MSKKCVNCTCDHTESKFYQDHGSCQYCYLVGCTKDDKGECKCNA